MGARQGLRASCASTANCCPRRNGRGSIGSSSTTSNCRWPRSASARRAKPQLREALASGAWSMDAAWCTSRRAPPLARCRARRVLDQARLPELRHRLSGARPAPVLLQFAARLVQELLRHRAQAWPNSTPSRAAKRPQWREADAEADAAPVLPGMRRRAPESSGAARAVPRPFDRGAHRPAGAGFRATPCGKFKLLGPRARHRARSAGRARRAHRISRATSASAICSSTAPPPRSPAARRSASASRRSSARICRASATSSTSRPSGCTRATTSRCSIRSIDCAARAIRWSWSSTTRIRFAAPIM